MAYSYPEIKRFLGLFAQANSFSLPDGAMEQCSNVVINDDNVISKTRGFYQYFDGANSDLKELFFYDDKLIAVFDDKASHFADTGTSPNETGSETIFTGETVSVTGTLKPKAVEQNGNLYFNTDNGVLKIDAIANPIFKAGAPAALDLRGTFFAANGPIPADSQIGVRVVFGRRDQNNNLIIGAPSDILVLTNRGASGATYTRSGAGPFTVTVSSTGHNLSVGMVINVTSDPTDAAIDGLRTVTEIVSPDSFRFSVPTSPAVSGGLNYLTDRAGLYEFSIPQDVTSTSEGWFYQVYRTTASNDENSSPSADFRLIDEKPLTSSEITARLVVYTDEVDDVLVEFNPELYTNPNSREGEDQANFQPPLCEDLTLFNEYVFYANCTQRQFLTLDVIDPASLVDNDYIETKVGATTRRYVGRTGVGNRTVRSELVDNSSGIRITYTGHNLLDGYKIYITTITGGTLTAGTYFVRDAAANTFKIAATSSGAAIAYNGETDLYFQGVDNGTYPIFQIDNTDPSVSVQLRNTAQGIVKAINRDTSSPVTANYSSGITDTPGKIRLATIGYVDSVFLRANTVTAGGAFSPALPDSFSTGTQVSSKSDNEQAAVYISKLGEPEAVPLVNKIFIGSRNRPIKRVIALRNSVIVLKSDGVFKITGDTPQNFTVTALDLTTRIVAAGTAVALSNQVYFLSTEGICIATDSSVLVVSRRIENKLEEVVGLPNIEAISYALAYDTDRTYRITTALPSNNTATIAYFHNVINDTWTESDELFMGGVVGPDNTLFVISLDNKIKKERKKGNRIDFSNQNYSVTINSVLSSKLGARITSSGVIPQEGDIIVKNTIINRIESVTLVTGSVYDVTFLRATDLEAADSVILYKRHQSIIKMAPFSGGLMQRTKQFGQLQLHTRSPSISRIKVSYTGQIFGASPTVDWKLNKIETRVGWGFAPWGYFPWGQSDGLNNFVSTKPSKPIRLYVPLFQQRQTFIQALLQHDEAGEAIDIQAMSWAMRVYQERVSK